MKDTLSVLLIEDSPSDTLLLKVHLERARATKYLLYTSVSLEEALTMLETIRPDIILLDLTLPGTSGIDTYRAVRMTQSATPVLILTGHYDTELALQCVQEGAAGYLVKDVAYNPDVLELNIALAIQVSQRILLEGQKEAVARRAAETQAAQLKNMPSILAACSVEGCGKVRDESIIVSGPDADPLKKWIPLPDYLEKHSEVALSHTYCPEHMPGLVKEALKK
jgi:two-component system cell cycle sensor histidine kinase/response regulator CckA